MINKSSNTGLEVDMREKLDNTMDVLPVRIKENGNSVMKLPEEKLVVCASNCEDHAFVDKAAKNSEENLVMTCASNCEDNAFHMEVDCDRDTASKGSDEDVEVDIVETVIPDEEMVVERESLDATENSSSFGCSDSGTGVTGTASDEEVESQVRDDNALLIEFDGTRKKKLTSHWRKFIHPLMWRCKWLELRIRELHSQASKYDRELAECGRRKQRELDKCADGNLAVKIAPLVYQNQSGSIMKRKKRKRVEETMDLAAYSSCHSLFSYFVSKRAPGDSVYLDDEHGNIEKTSGKFVVNGEWSFLEFKDSDAFEDVLRKIEVAQVHVRQLKTRIDNVVRETAERYVPVISSLAPSEPSTSCGPRSTFANLNVENTRMGSLPTTSQEKKLVLPESGASGYKEVKPSPNLIGTTDQFEKHDKTEIGTLVCNPSVKEEVKAELLEHVPDPNSPNRISVSQDQQPVEILPKLNTTTKNKKKRGRRKARASRWSKRSSG